MNVHVTAKAGGVARAGQSLTVLNATVEVADVREDTMQGRAYLVAPVVAIVQGVLQGANSDVPELALAGAFGAHPEGWDGRPVVMNHPYVDGDYVSANSPAVLSDWGFGHIFAARVEDDKLKVEAWIDIDRANEQGGEFASTLTRLQNKEPVEVSVGAFIEQMETSGVYHGKDYGAVWVNVVPDHLALLSDGVKGACSIADGCGAPRVNTSGSEDMSVKSTATTTSAPCTCGGDDHDQSTKPAGSYAGIQIPPPPSSSPTSAAPVVAAVAAVATVAAEPKFVVGASESARRMSTLLSVNALPRDRFNNDIYKAIAKAVYKDYPYSYCMGYTVDHAYYDTYVEGSGYVYMRVGVDVSSDLVVKFTGDPEEVKLVTSVIVVNEEKEMTVAEGNKPATEVTPAAPAADVAPVTTPTPTVNASETSHQPAEMPVRTAPLSVNDYIAAAPEGLREVLSESVRVHAEARTALITALKETKRCKFSDTQLAAMSVEQLRSMAELAGINDVQAAPTLVDYSGRALPRVHAAPTEADFYAAPPPSVFETAKSN
jgi:hypothetical protein